MSDSQNAPDGGIPTSEAIAQFVASLPPLPHSLGGLAPDSTSAPPQASEPAPAQTPGEPEKPAVAKQEKPEDQERYARGFARLAQKEAALVAREREFEAKMAGAEKAAAEQFQAKFRANPIRFLREMGLDNEQISTMGRAALGATLENAPPQYRELADKLRLDEQNEDVRSELKKLREELAAEKGQRAEAERAQAYRAEYHANLTKYVQAQELSEQAPNVARLFSHDADGTLRRIYDVVARDAQEKIRSGRHGEPLSPMEAVKALDAELAVYARTFGSAGTTSTPETARATSAPARKSLSDSTVNPAPASREMPDPEKDWSAWKKAKEAEFLAELQRSGR